MKHQNNIYMLGAGKMGGAMLQKWINHPNVAKLSIIDPRPSEEMISLRDKHSHIDLFTSWREMLVHNHQQIQQQNDCNNILVLAVKPQIMKDALERMLEVTMDQTMEQKLHFDMVISIAAGIKIAFLEAFFAPNTSIIRLMPNTPVCVGKGVCAYFANKKTTENDLINLDALLSVLGTSYRLQEEGLLHAVTATSGSGPAYLYALTESIAHAAKALGIDEELAQHIARQTVIGAAELMAMDFETDVAQLRQNVTSKGGTTEAALQILKGDDEALHKLLFKAMQAALERSKLLSEL